MTFVLDPDYINFEQHSTPLKLSTITGMGVSDTVILTLFGVFFAGFLAVMFVYTEQLQAQFRAQGVETTMMVASCSTVRSSSKSSSSHTASIDFTYMVNGERTTGNTILSGKCDNYPLETKMSGVYMANDPSQIIIMSMEQLNAPFYQRQSGFFPGLIFEIGAIAFVLWMVRKVIVGRGKKARLENDGRILNGEILRVNGRTRNKSRSYYVTVECEFETPEGHTLKRRQSKRRQDLRYGALPPVGGRILVLYADDNTFVLL